MENQNQMQKYSTTQLTAKSEEVLVTAAKIIDGSQNIGLLEMNLQLEKTFDKPLMKTVFKNEDAATIAFGVVQVLIKRFLESFGFSTKPSQVLIDMMAVDALTKFEYETLDDIIIFLKMCRQGDLGTTMKGIDSNLVFGEWFPKYMDLKAQKREEIYTKQKNVPDDNNAVAKYYQKQREKKAFREWQDKKFSQIDDLVKDFNRKNLEDTIEDWSTREEMKPYLEYLKRKRLTIKS
jgi:hypothetical protein